MAPSTWPAISNRATAPVTSFRVLSTVVLATSSRPSRAAISSGAVRPMIADGHGLFRQQSVQQQAVGLNIDGVQFVAGQISLGREEQGRLFAGLHGDQVVCAARASAGTGRRRLSPPPRLSGSRGRTCQHGLRSRGGFQRPLEVVEVALHAHFLMLRLAAARCTSCRPPPREDDDAVRLARLSLAAEDHPRPGGAGRVGSAGRDGRHKNEKNDRKEAKGIAFFVHRYQSSRGGMGFALE